MVGGLVSSQKKKNCLKSKETGFWGEEEKKKGRWSVGGGKGRRGKKKTKKGQCFPFSNC